MKMSKLSLAGYLLSILTIFAGIIKYPFGFKFLVVIAVGCGVAFLAYLYSFMRKTDRRYEELKDRLDAMASWWVGAEKTTIESIARGQTE